MAKSTYKKSYYHPSLIKKLFNLKLNKIIKNRLIFNRGSHIPTSLLKANQYLVHKGNSFSKVYGSIELKYAKFGALSLTRRPFFYAKKDKKR